MLTARGSMILFIASTTLVGGLIASRESVALAALALIMWLFLAWASMLWLQFRRPVLASARRSINGSVEPELVVTLGNEYRIQTRWQVPVLAPGTLLRVDDILPATFRLRPAGGGESPAGSIGTDYFMIPETCGRYDLPGLAVEAADPWGFFRMRRFVPCFQRVTVLPYMMRAESTRPVVKSSNLQNMPGQHAFRRSGVSAELLGIREFRDGDPPRTIAWKATARTGAWMSREFEMEVPLRSTILCGIAQGQFRGWPETTAADRQITATASLARLLLSDRDPVALMFSTEHGTTRLPHAGGQRQLIRILHRLLNITPQSTLEREASLEWNIDQVLEAAACRFPDLLPQSLSGFRSIRMRLRPARKRNDAKRRRAAMIVAHALGMKPGSEIRLVFDDEAMKSACVDFSHRFHVITRRRGERHYTGTADSQRDLVARLAASLLQSCRMARDQELMVLVAEFPETGPEQERLLDAMRVCRAAGHRVMAIHAPALESKTEPWHDEDAHRIVQGLEQSGFRFRAGIESFRERLKQLGVATSEIVHPGLIRQVAVEMELLRSSRSRSSRTGSSFHVRNPG